MGILLRQSDERSQYQERIAADLRERAKRQAAGSEPLDQSARSNYIKDTNQTSARAWIWLVGLGLVIVGFVVFAITR